MSAGRPVPVGHPGLSLPGQPGPGHLPVPAEGDGRPGPPQHGHGHRGGPPRWGFRCEGVARWIPVGPSLKRVPAVSP